MPDNSIPNIRLGPIGQIALTVKDLDRATAVWRDELGVRFLFQVPGMAFFDCGGIRVMLSRSEQPERTYSSIVDFRVDDIARAHEVLAAREVPFVREPHIVADLGSHVLWLAFFRDSEDNLLALMSEVPKA
jgi:methylmalonyl-CoA/ethylmalonyl-CoA epimerase